MHGKPRQADILEVSDADSVALIDPDAATEEPPTTPEPSEEFAQSVIATPQNEASSAEVAREEDPLPVAATPKDQPFDLFSHVA